MSGRPTASRRGSADERAEGEQDLLAKIAEMPEPDRAMAKRIHAIVTASAPDLEPKTYYGMPAYAKDGKTICFFKPASKFKVRYATFGFEQDARLDDGDNVAGVLRAHRADGRRRGADRRAREESSGEAEDPPGVPPVATADSHDLIRVHGARVNNLKDISVEIPKRRLTVFTGVPAPARARWSSARSPPSRSG